GYTVRDSHGATATARVTVGITAPNHPPVAVDDRIILKENARRQLLEARLLANDTDPDPGSLALSITAVNTNGTRGLVQFIAGSGLTYNPTGAFSNLADGVVVTDSFAYTIRDTAGATSNAQVTVRIVGVDDPAVALPDTVRINEHQD